MKIISCVFGGMLALTLVTVSVISAAPDASGVPAQMVVTVLAGKDGRSQKLNSGDLRVLQGKDPAPVVRLQRLAADWADMQLFLLLDDSTRSASLGTQLPELKTFVSSLPATTQVAVGYMRNGTFALAQAFTADHALAARALRLPLAMPGQNGSPYFALSNLVKHWPSNQAASRRAVLMLTDGVDRYFSAATVDDPYVDAAVHDALRQGVLVYSIYLRGAGLYGRGGFVTNIAQSRLAEIGEETGGYAYFQAFTDPVSISPFLTDLGQRFDSQYLVTIQAAQKGFHPVKVRTELPGLKIDAPTQIFVR